MINTDVNNDIKVEEIKAINSVAYKLFMNEMDRNEMDRNEMDMKELKNKELNKTDITLITQKNRTKEQIDELINSIDNNSMNKSYFTPQFAGWDDNEIINSKMDKYNPNLFYINKSTNQSTKRGINVRVEDIKFKKRVKNKSKTKTIKITKKKVEINIEIENLDDLIKLINDFPEDETIEYNIDMDSLYKIKTPLIELNNMVGMKQMKENIVDQILYYIQGLHKINDIASYDFMHTVIYGPPGTGKTEVAKIIGSIFSKLGILKKGTFKKVVRSDLVAGYLGQTAIKTKEVIEECLGGCLFIDEAYALGNSEKRDSFSKECIDTLCEALSDHKDELMVIIAGYEIELNECFFAYNQGLNSRFTWRFKTEDYKAEELYKIFLKKVSDCKWTIDESDKNINIEWFNKNIEYFKYFGRDIETLLSKIKIAHSRRVFCKSVDEKTKITYKDLEKGLQIYLKNEEVKNRKGTSFRDNYLKTTMYS
jgi:ATP-dependent 26S proteasome regulatory subunit